MTSRFGQKDGKRRRLRSWQGLTNHGTPSLGETPRVRPLRAARQGGGRPILVRTESTEGRLPAVGSSSRPHPVHRCLPLARLCPSLPTPIGFPCSRRPAARRKTSMASGLCRQGGACSGSSCSPGPSTQPVRTTHTSPSPATRSTRSSGTPWAPFRRAFPRRRCWSQESIRQWLRSCRYGTFFEGYVCGSRRDRMSRGPWASTDRRR